jgi:hypothetical protein
MAALPCRLSLDACTGAACAFWEEDGCMVERLGLQRLHDTYVRAFLLDLRAQLEAVNAAAGPGD